MEIIKIQTNQKSEIVEFNGIIYRRYPQSKTFSDRNYFRCKIADKKKGFGFLHRDVWKYHNGEIPQGFHIHHKDENALNNSIENLEAVSPTEHNKKHILTPRQRQSISYQKTRRYALEKATKAAVNWHRSDEGRKWHSEHGKNAYKKRPYLEKVCNFCLNNFQTKHSITKFCSNKCKSSWRRAQELDNENRVCKNCDKNYSVNKYDKSNCCSLSCAAKLRWTFRKRMRENSNVKM